ncbi:MAG TPA: efflux RND transporter periplasmic adaptor subunit [Steroidobacteraceae bacterium]|nr:efflux RND transporter periplasmic adaptor subunit [Steroidobacteraceae bacterium]
MSEENPNPPPGGSASGGSAAPAGNGNGNGKRRRILLILAGIFVTLGIAWALLDIFVFSLREKTDDAYVVGNQVGVSAEVGGTVVEVLARNTSRVAAGQPLLRLDDTDAKQQLERAAAQLAQTVRQVRMQQAQATQYDAGIAERELQLTQAQENLARREPLLAEHAVAGEEVRHAREAVELAQAGLNEARQQAAAAHALVAGVSLEQNPAVQAASTAYQDAWLILHRTTVVAPVAGYVAQRTVQLGQRIAPAEHLLTIIPLADVWLEANFKEGQLRNLRLGQPAKVVSDLYGGDVVFHGRVIGLSAGTGAAFSLLPPQNASGNWIKVVQRVPVKIALDPQELAQHPLRIGLSVVATVDTHDRNGAVLAPEPVSDVHEVTSAYATDLAKAHDEALKIIRANAG